MKRILVAFVLSLLIVTSLVASGKFTQFDAGGVLTGVAVTPTITSPTSAATYNAGTSSSVAVSGTTLSDRPINSCTWSTDQGGSGVTTGKLSWSIASVPLVVGTTNLTVTCTNDAGVTGQDTLAITRSNPSSGEPIDALRLPDLTSTAPSPIWGAAGVTGGIPSGSWAICNNTACNNLATGGTGAVSTATINSAISGAQVNGVACGQALPCVVPIRAITQSVTGVVNMKSYVALRGAGANQTLLTFTTTGGCSGDQNAAFCFGDPTGLAYNGATDIAIGNTNSATWTSGFAKGTTQIVLSGIGSNGISLSKTGGMYLMLDQDNDPAVTNGFFICDVVHPCTDEGGAFDPGRVRGTVSRQQIQVVKVTACSPSCTNGATFTISPGLYAGNWSGTKNPGVYWAPTNITMTGLEDLSVTTTADGVNPVEILNANNVWVTGLRIFRNCTNCTRSSIRMWQVSHATIHSNYLYGPRSSSSTYGIESYAASDLLVTNNIIQNLATPIMLHTNEGSVYGYNFAIHNTYDDGGTPLFHWMIQSIIAHSAGVMLNLFEGNVANGIGGDAIHGNSVMNTVFRNRFSGLEVGRIDNTYPIMFEAYARYWNVVGNVLGTSTYHTNYATGNGSPDSSIYDLGMVRGTTGPDTVLASTLLRWGNWDTVTSTNEANTNDLTGTRFVSSEVPTTAPTYPNAVPSSQTLPSSYYLSAKPSWWPASKVWPIVGPDISNGNIPNTGGHANTNPAQDCYLNVMGGPADGTGAVLTFNRATCYP
jgi:hypothetical protein